jgi:hypothetical protein
LYGNDSIALGLPGDGTPSLAGQNVGGIAAKEFFMGSFGLNPAATNFSTFNNPVQSYMSSLRAQNQIPSLSYGYTAGNQYHGNGVLGSLTLGGYDANLFEPNNLTLVLDAQSEFDLTINIDKITMSSRNGNTPLSSASFPAFVDTTLPYLYLPIEVCTAFEEAFGIVYDNASGLYLVNDTLHSQLLAQSANVTFSLTNTTGNTIVDIILPYRAFDLIAEWPLVENTSRYFPLKRAANDTQTTLGRAFLQEAYLIADYERSSFSIHQRTYAKTAQDIRTILPLGEAPPTNPTGSNNVKIAVAVGGSVGGAILITLATGFVILIRQRSQRIAALANMEFKIESLAPSRTLSNATAPTHMEGWKPELDATCTQKKSPELDTGSPKFKSICPPVLAINTSSMTLHEVRGVHEMEANEPVMAEVAGSPVEQLLQAAIDDILEQEMSAWEESPQRSVVGEAANDVVSPLSPDDEIIYMGYMGQDVR